MRAKAVADGQLVEIPVLGIFRTVGTQEDKQTGEWKNPAKRKVIPLRKNRAGEAKRNRERKKSSEAAESKLSRKAAIEIYLPVPKTDTGRRGENPQAGGRSVVKELGKMTP